MEVLRGKRVNELDACYPHPPLRGTFPQRGKAKRSTCAIIALPLWGEGKEEAHNIAFPLWGKVAPEEPDEGHHV